MLIKENTNPTAMRGINNTIKDVRSDLKRSNNIEKIAPNTKTKEVIWEPKRLCSKLLYKTPKPLSWYSTLVFSNLVCK